MKTGSWAERKSMLCESQYVAMSLLNLEGLSEEVSWPLRPE